MNIDKIKSILGVQLFDFIGSLNAEQLEKQLAALKSDMQDFQHQYCNEIKVQRNAELWLIEYRL